MNHENSKYFGECINYMINIYKECQAKSPFEYGYYSSAVHWHEQSMRFNAINNPENFINIKSDVNSNCSSSNSSNGTNPNILRRISNAHNNMANNKIVDHTFSDGRSSCTANEINTHERNENVINFFHMYLIKKYCERNFLFSLHNRFIRSMLYNYMENTSFLNYIQQDMYFIHCYIQIVAYVLLKNKNCDTDLLKVASGMLSALKKEMDNLKKYMFFQPVTANLSKEKCDPSNSLIKYVYFMTEFLAKNPNYDFINLLFSTYSCMSIFPTVYYLCSLCFNSSKRASGEAKGTDGKVLKNGLIYDEYMLRYANRDFINCSEFFFYYITKKKFNDARNITVSSIYKDLQIANYTAFLEKLLFIENSIKYSKEKKGEEANGEENKENDEIFRSIRVEILRQIFSFNEKSKLTLDLSDFKKNGKEKKTKTHTQELIADSINDGGCVEDINMPNNNLESLKRTMDFCETFSLYSEVMGKSYNSRENSASEENINEDEDFMDTQLDYSKAKYKLNTDFFQSFYKGKEYDTNQKEIQKDNGFLEARYKHFINLFNNNFHDNSYYLSCIDYFCYIGIDFDKTITVKDSYQYLNKLIKQYYDCPTKQKVQLTEEEVHYFDNILTVDWKNKKREFSAEERLLHLAKINRWFSIKEKEIMEELQNKKEISNVHDESYTRVLKLVDTVNRKYCYLISYYDIVKDIDVQKLDTAIFENYKALKVHDYFLNFFVNAISYKQKRKQADFYFDIITLNCKKELCIAAIKNNLQEFFNLNNNSRNNIDNNNNIDDNNNNNNNNMYCNENTETLETVDDVWFEKFQKHFNIYYSKSTEYAQKEMKYTGSINSDATVEIYSKRYCNKNETRQTLFLSLFDKTTIFKTVHSFINNNNNNNKLTCFIGDSLYDIDVLIAADIPIVIGSNKLFSLFCEKHNILIKPLILAAAKIEYIIHTSQQRGEKIEDVNISERLQNLKKERSEALVEMFDEQKKVIYSAQSWLEIGIFFFGNQF